MAIHELCASIAATKESLKAKNQKVQFEMKYHLKKDSHQCFKISNNGGKPGVKWTDDRFKFWPKKKIGTVKSLQKKDFEMVKRLCGKFGCMKTVTVKYERPGLW